jgi:hypothetical protein
MTQFKPGDRVFFVGTRATKGNAADSVFATHPEWATVAAGEMEGGRVPVVYDHTLGNTFYVRAELLIPRWDAPVPDPRHEYVSITSESNADEAYERGRADGWAAAVDAVTEALKEATT